MEAQPEQYKCLTKSQLAQLCGVSCSTLQAWLNRRYYGELQKLGYRKSQRILLPPQVKFLIETLVIIIE